MSAPIVPLEHAFAYALYDLVEAHILSTYPDVSVRHTSGAAPAGGTRLG